MSSKKESVISLRESGKSFNEISKLLNCSKSYISTICKENKLSDIGLSVSKKLSSVEIEELKEYYKTHTKQETAIKFEVSISTVTKYKDNKRVNLTEEELSKNNYNHVKSFRKKNKERAIEYKGGKCIICEYNRCTTALEFHHLDPTKKDFGISSNTNRAWDKIKEELDKCILVCSNCHREIHDGIIKIGT